VRHHRHPACSPFSYSLWHRARFLDVTYRCSHTVIHPLTCAHVHSHLPTCTNTHMHMHTHTHTHTHARTHAHTHTRSHSRSRSRTRTCARARTYTHTHTHAPTHIHILSPSLPPLLTPPPTPHTHITIRYVHSARDDDLGVVYDNAHGALGRGQRSVALTICGNGYAHLNSEPFNGNDPWGWGRGWRQNREFVGRVSYGVRWMLWGPETHRRFPPNFRNAVMILLAGANRPDSLLYWLPHEVRAHLPARFALLHPPHSV
jgi:hypothetical protein